MSEERTPVMVITVKVPKSHGNKTLKIELFAASDFQNQWNPYQGWKFHPTVPGMRSPRDVYFMERFRLRINGKWFSKKAKYQTFTKQEIFDNVARLWHEFNNRGKVQ